MLRHATSASEISWKPATPWVIALVPTIIMVGAALNGMMARAIESWRSTGFDSVFLGISPFDLLVLVVAAHLSVSSARDVFGERLGWPEILTAVAVLAPSSAVSWAALAFYAGWRSLRTSAGPRSGALLFLALAATSLWSSVAIKWLAVPLTSTEASIVWSLVSAFRDDIALAQNVIGWPDGHRVVLLPACATAVLLPKAIIAVAAIAALFGGVRPGRLVVATLLVGAALGLGNWGRLALMAWSHESFLLVHGPVGANLFDVFQSLCILGAGMWLGRRQ